MAYLYCFFDNFYCQTIVAWKRRKMMMMIIITIFYQLNVYM